MTLIAASLSLSHSTHAMSYPILAAAFPELSFFFFSRWFRRVFSYSPAGALRDVKSLLPLQPAWGFLKDERHNTCMRKKLRLDISCKVGCVHEQPRP